MGYRTSLTGTPFGINLTVLLFCVALTFTTVVECIVDNRKFKLVETKYLYEHKKHPSLIDHVNYVKTDYYNMTYLSDFTNWKPNGPILFYTGNEGVIEHFAENTGFMNELAVNLSGAVIFAEHRYYGSSMPFGNESFADPSKFGYLSAEQALADFAKFLVDFKCANPKFTSAPVISFGGSYGGMLTAWFRQAYPNIVAGGLAASAPVWLFPGMSDCQGFSRVTTDAYRTAGGVECTSLIRKVWDLIEDIGKTADGLSQLSKAFNTCKPIPSACFFYEFASDYLVTIAMGNYPYEASFLGDLPAWPVHAFCEELKGSSSQNKDSEDLPPEVLHFARAFFAIANYKRTNECLSFDDDSSNLDANGWELQTCMEMTMAICSDGVKDMFKPRNWDPISFSNYCQKKYGVRPRMDWANTQFWGKELYSLTNVIFSNGDLDPWSAFGVLDDKAFPNLDIIRIATGAHHLDLRGSHPGDTKEVIEARQRSTAIIKKWIEEWHSQLHPVPLCI